MALRMPLQRSPPRVAVCTPAVENQVVGVESAVGSALGFATGLSLVNLYVHGHTYGRRVQSGCIQCEPVGQGTAQRGCVSVQQQGLTGGQDNLETRRWLLSWLSVAASATQCVLFFSAGCSHYSANRVAQVVAVGTAATAWYLCRAMIVEAREWTGCPHALLQEVKESL